MKIITHSGSFQADDIFAVAILMLLVGESDVVRTRDKTQFATADYVVDVGMIYDPKKFRFDHHQPGGAGERLNGIPYASCGLVWKEFGERLAGGKDEADFIDLNLMQPLDAHDNGISIADYRFKDVRTYSIVDFFYSYIPNGHNSEEVLYKIFMELVAMARDLLVREISKAQWIVASEAKVQKALDFRVDKRVLVLSEELPWKRVLSKVLEVVYVVYPRNDGQWGLRAVQDTGYISRRPLPANWGGQTDQNLQAMTGVSDAVFCHRGLFLAVAKTKEGAMRLAEMALNA